MRAYEQQPHTRQKRLAKYAALPKQRKREYHLQRMYGISVADYEQMFAEQDGRCAICNSDGNVRPNRRTYQGLMVDHDNETGAIRGLLCNNCNSGIGLLGAHDLQRAEAMVDYLKRARERTPRFVVDEPRRAYLALRPQRTRDLRARREDHASF